ncbi:MAG: glycosyltransferase family 4 protein [Candidatus Margulisbacteria bacterium]|nr:glycosyltransferase family 4 protein [Candidatus Margulisiibacteriota bacterium]
MKILMQNRVDAFSAPGGDTVQMRKTKEYLEKLGVTVDISLALEPDLGRYDLVHLFNVARIHETYLQFLNAKRQHKPVVVSTIYSDYFDELDIKGAYGIKGSILKKFSKEGREKLKCVYRAVMDLRQVKASWRLLKVGFTEEQKQVIQGADMILPNSNMELAKVRDNFGAVRDSEVVPNAVEPQFIEKDSSFADQYGQKDYVLCVANYIPRKNQHNLLRAMQGTGLVLVMIGGIVNTHIGYYKRLKKMSDQSDGKIIVLPKTTQEKLVSIYSGARVIALPSWGETTGLSCLEGALAGCNVVITDRGYTREYFRDMAYYCDPADVGSIREAVLKAYQAPPATKLKEHILNNYTWDKTAEATLNAYRRVLGK